MTTKDTKPKVEFFGADHPVCMQCVSSLMRDERYEECGGDGFICLGEPDGWYCPTCDAHWRYSELDYPPEEEE